MASCFRLLPAVPLLGMAILARADDAPNPPGILTLVNGHTVAGEFRPSEAPDAVRWQGESFTEPFEFVTPALASIQFPAQQPLAGLRGEFAVELAGGDVLSGRVAGWSEETVTLESPQFGTVRIRRDAVRRMHRLEGNPALVYSGPSGLTGWNPVGPGVWKEDGPHIWTDQNQAMLRADLGVPDRAVVEFELAWEKSPSFVFAVGVDANAMADTRLDGWRFEAWGGQDGTLAVVREQREIADVDAVQALSDAPQRVHLIAYLDQKAGTMHVFRPDGTPAGKIAVPVPDTPSDRRGQPGRGVRIVNRHGHVRLERLRIACWSGPLPAPGDGRPRLELADGTSLSGEIVGFEPDSRQFLVRAGEEERSIDALELVALEMPPTAAPEGRIVTAVLQDGTRLSGRIGGLRDDELIVGSPQTDEPFHVPYRNLRSLLFLEKGDLAAAPAGDGRRGRLELGGHQLAGSLAGAPARPDASCLAWHPAGSRTSSPLKPEAAGRIVYRDPPPPPPPTRTTRKTVLAQPQRVRARGDFGALFLRTAADPPAKPVEGHPHNLHLLSGDVIPCTITAIDERGVHITSSVAEARVVPHAGLKAAEMSQSAPPPNLQSAKKERLLTVPRLQKGSPPTHLLCSRTGDFLRCRLIGLTDDHIRVEVQLAEIEVPKDRVSHIIWFDPSELGEEREAPSADAPDPPPAAARLAQVIRSNGNRVTFEPHQVDGGILSGASEILGTCRFELAGIDQLIFGGQIEVAAAELPFHQWRLRPAVEPLVAQDFGEGGNTSGTVSPLIGQPAPDIDLKLVGGGQFRLSECRGQIVVLDFWASWCGPCMQTMPLTEEAMREFDPAQVRLVAVNMEEPADHVKSVLERHDLKVAVALDQDGVAARRYEANTIPQLVIVDRQGNVARLYVGGGRNVVEQLRATLGEMLGPEG